MIREALADLPQFRSAKVLYGFCPMELEPDWLEAARASGAALVLPRFTGKAYRFALVPDWNSLEVGPMGILQPPESDGCPPPPDLILVPGLGFDRLGHRLGHGKGIYDRLLEGLPGMRVGVAFAAQVIYEIPTQGHDQSVDALVTEHGFFPCSGGNPSHRHGAEVPQGGPPNQSDR